MTDASGADQVTAVNDVTAIDAATGEAADMAADVNYTFNEPETNGDRRQRGGQHGGERGGRQQPLG